MVGAALLEESLVGPFLVMREGREDFGRHAAGGVQAGVVEGADGLVHPIFEGGRGGKGPVCGGPGLEEEVWDDVAGFREEAVTELGQLDLLRIVEWGGASFREEAFVYPVHLHRALQGPIQVTLEFGDVRWVVEIAEV